MLYNNLMKTILSILAAVILSAGIAYSLDSKPAPVSFGAAYNPTAGGTYRLQSSIGTTDTSITLTSFKEPISGIPYTMSYLNSNIEYATIEPQSNNREFISFSGITQNADNSATLTGVTRGLSGSYPFTASTTFQLAHAGQTILILSNPPQLYNNFYNLNNVATSSNILFFSSTTPPRYDEMAAQANGSYISTTSEFASVGYVNAVALTSAPNANTTVKGVVQFATALQAASSTATGSTGALLALGNGIATDTPNTATRGSVVLMSQIGGFLNQAWLNLSAAWTWTGLGTFSGGLTSTATTTLAGSNYLSNALKINTVPYQFPSTQGAANTVWLNNGSGVLTSTTISRIVFATTTTAVIVNTGGTAITANIPGGTMGTTGGIRGRFYATWETTANAGMNLVLIYGGSTCVTSGSASAGGTTDVIYRGYINFTILNVNTSSQVCDLSFQGSQNSANIGTAATTMSTAGTGTTAVNSANAQTLSVTVTQNSTGQTLTIYDGTIEQIF